MAPAGHADSGRSGSAIAIATATVTVTVTAGRMRDSDPFVDIPGLIGLCRDGGWVPVPGVRTTGTIRFLTSGGFRAIVADDGTIYSPTLALDSSFQTEGLRVTFSGEFVGSAEGDPPRQRIDLRSISTP